MKSKLIIATRTSPLALWQANFVKAQLEKLHPEIKFELLGLHTQGDIQLGTPLYEIGGKALFVKELEQALLDDRADIAVHSLKDMPAKCPEGLGLTVICKREDPRDVFISNRFSKLNDLPLRSTLGTSSLRRQCQIKILRPDLHIKPLRGNVGTRLNKLDNDEFDAIILAAAGIKRLGFEDRIRMYFATEMFVPAVAQGVLGIESRLEDKETLSLIQPLDHTNTRLCVTAERAFNLALDGGCKVPLAAYATISNNNLLITGLVGNPDGSIQIRGSLVGDVNAPHELGLALANNLLNNGAHKILAKINLGSI